MSSLGRLCFCSIRQAVEYGFKESDFSGHAPKCEARWQKYINRPKSIKEYQHRYYLEVRKPKRAELIRKAKMWGEE